MYFLVLNYYRYINKMCAFQYSSDMKSSENIKDKLGVVGVSGRDPADDDDDYRIQCKLRDTLE